VPNKEFIVPLFQKVAPFYDLLNNCLSFGIHWVWKKHAVKEVLSFMPRKVLDGATGTGDLLSLLEQRGVSTIGVDISQQMLDEGKKKYPSSQFVKGDLTALEFQDDFFDVSVVGFGVRNVDNLEKARDELIRVSNKGIIILEFGSPENTIIRKIYFSLMRLYVPLLGSLFGRYKDYKYLIESSEKFVSGKKFTKFFSANEKVKQAEYRTFMGGAVYLYKFKL